MKRIQKSRTIILINILLFAIVGANAQFYTVTKEIKPKYILLKNETDNKQDGEQPLDENNKEGHEEKPVEGIDSVKDRSQFRLARKRPPRGTATSSSNRKSGDNSKKLSGLTIANLLKEIEGNGIQHPKIVLAQAILETGWFTSSVSRNKGNLFGLTNPRTGNYYEFDHWTESVKAYKDKVQYKYKGGNYLLWLKKIGYAEDPRYISSVADIIEQYML